MATLEGSFATGAFTHQNHHHHQLGGASLGGASTGSGGLGVDADGEAHTPIPVHYDTYRGAYIEDDDGKTRPANASFGGFSTGSFPNSSRRHRSGSKRAISGRSHAHSPTDESAPLIGEEGNLQNGACTTPPPDARGGDNNEESWDSLAMHEEAAPASCCQLRWLAMVFICLITLGQYYIFDFPGAIGIGEHGTIQDRFHRHGKKYNQVMNQALYSIYSWPNTVLALAGGILIDRFLGLRRATIVFGTLVCLGGWLFYIGVQSTQYPIMMLGRFVFGLGAESMSVAQSCFVARYFADGKGIALAFGVTITVCRVASTANFFFSPRIATSSGVEVSVLIGAIVTCISLASGIALSIVDKVAESKGKVVAWTKDESQKFQCLAIFQLPASSLLLGGICAFVYASIFPFIGIARDFFTTMYGLSGTAGATQVSFYQLASAIGSPLLGGVVDRTGYSIVWLAGACLCFAGVHVVFALTAAIPAAVMMATMGLFYCVLVSSLWPSCPKTVDAARVGLAYGAMTSMQNTLLALTPLATGSILDHFEVPTGCNTPAAPNATTFAPSTTTTTTTAGPTSTPTNPNATCAPGSVMMQASKSGYQYVEVLFIGLAMVAFCLTLVLWAVQRRVGGILHLSGKDAKERQVELAGELAAAAAADAMDSTLL